MPGTITPVNQAKRSLEQTPSYDYTHRLTLDGAGNISGVAIPDLSLGLLYQVETVPDGATPPTDGYQLQLLNDLGVDVLGGGGVNRSAANKQILHPSGMPPAVKAPLYPTITGAGAGAIITLRLTLLGV